MKLNFSFYYPFGLQHSTSYQRAFTTKNRWGFQGQEHIDDLDLGWISFKWRNHMPDIGRFFNVDPLAEDYVHNSTYAFSENDVISAIELEGLEKIRITNYSAIQSKKLQDSFNKKETISKKPVSVKNTRSNKLESLRKENWEINRIISYGGSNGFKDDYMVNKLESNNIDVPDDVKNGKSTIGIEIIDPKADYSIEVHGVTENEDGRIEVSKFGEINENKEQRDVDIETAEEVGKIIIQNTVEYLLLRFLKYPVEFYPLPVETEIK